MSDHRNSLFAVNATGQQITQVQVIYSTSGHECQIAAETLEPTQSTQTKTMTSVSHHSDHWSVRFFRGGTEYVKTDFSYRVPNDDNGTFTIVLGETHATIVRPDGDTLSEKLDRI